jgi:hypothetical protein
VPLNPFATRPYCLDSEFLPRHLLEAGIDGLSREHELARADAAYREFIRALIFSPQILIGRESCAQHPILVAAALHERSALEKLIEDDRINILLMTSRDPSGKALEETSLLNFLERTHFKIQRECVDAWKSIVQSLGDSAMRYVKLAPDQSTSMERRFTDFCNSPPGDPSLMRVFADSLGRAPSEDEQKGFHDFWKIDLKQYRRWLEDHDQYVISRSMIYDQFIRPNPKSTLHYAEGLSPAAQARRKLLRQPLKLMTDLAYNANTPATLGIKSFVPPEMPDPVGFPFHLYHAPAVFNASHARQEAAVAGACELVVDRRISAREQFFYETQAYETLPDIGSFTLQDAVEVMAWPEWIAFKYAQQATMTFEKAEQLPALMKDYWSTIKTLHEKLSATARSRSHWRMVARGGASLCISVVANVMGQALLPDAVSHAPWWVNIVASDVVTRPIQAGIDIVVHGIEMGANRLLVETGFKDGGMREFTISSEMKLKLEALKEAEQRAAKPAEMDLQIATASAAIAAEG